MGVTASLGYRRYRPVGSGIAAYLAGGGTVGVGRSRSETNHAGDPEITGRTYLVGAFADAGAMLLVTPRLGFSAVYGLSVQRTSNRSEFDGGTVSPGATGRDRGWSLGLGGVRFNASIFF